MYEKFQSKQVMNKESYEAIFPLFLDKRPCSFYLK